MSSEGVPGGTDRDAEIARKDAQWAAKADAAHGAAGFRGDAGGAAGATDHGAAGPAAPGYAAGHRGTGPTPAGEPQPYRTPKHLRSSSGPRFSGRGVLAVFGILGVLLTVGIMVLLFVKVIDGVSGDGDGDGTSGTSSSDEPAAGTAEPSGGGAGPVVPVAPGSPDGAQLDPDAPLDSTKAAACETERLTIETAAEAYSILEGTRATSVDEIIAQGMLTPPEGGFSHELSPDGAVVGTGECATG